MIHITLFRSLNTILTVASKGMRYQRRGINEAGDVANFVETEQLVLFERDGDSHAASFVQTRGSSKLLKLF